mmetsp:Transcript_24212/g.56221  ORF Transcript_24212/g.56221 Transcript_24212/m.56221 type:complete len:216 (+) Transcript_24212:69-716(+)|eukprot:CAMPEP_0178414758 /NCGR_PEP_ID=MMETSP0689_2-20121128/23201_1 /TAXON_ID=160604 /ORGANISM="Amphidinium massartii, Strain CS-259" /LENGTH=215 /DNA_ID=CAMNT_0020036057 /DNA_START=75 /DNA_END=722 /DNA_ORIENTATION=+
MATPLFRGVLCISLALAASALSTHGRVPNWACPMQAPQLASSGAVKSAVRLHSHEEVTGSAQSNVTAVDSQALEALCSEDKEFLVVFFDPHCPHCRQFVLSGDPEPPIEMLADFLKAEEGPAVVKYDTQQGMPPAEFVVQYVPTIFHSKGSSSGCSLTQFTGDQNNLDLVKQFAMDGRMPATPGTTAAPMGPTVLVMANTGTSRSLRSKQEAMKL